MTEAHIDKLRDKTPNVSYPEYPKEVKSIFVHFEIAAQDYVRRQYKVSNKTLSKHLDVARRKAFDEVLALLLKEKTDLLDEVLEATSAMRKPEYEAKFYKTKPTLIKYRTINKTLSELRDTLTKMKGQK